MGKVGMVKNQVESAKEGARFASDGAAKNKPAPLSDDGVKKGKTYKGGVKVNSGKSSPVGDKLPTGDGGPRKSQKSAAVGKGDPYGPTQGEGTHGQKVPKGATNRFDLYADARK